MLNTQGLQVPNPAQTSRDPGFRFEISLSLILTTALFSHVDEPARGIRSAGLNQQKWTLATKGICPWEDQYFITAQPSSDEQRVSPSI